MLIYNCSKGKERKRKEVFIMAILTIRDDDRCEKLQREIKEDEDIFDVILDIMDFYYNAELLEDSEFTFKNIFTGFFVYPENENIKNYWDVSFNWDGNFNHEAIIKRI
jgi:hypothetical protein